MSSTGREIAEGLAAFLGTYSHTRRENKRDEEDMQRFNLYYKIAARNAEIAQESAALNRQILQRQQERERIEQARIDTARVAFAEKYPGQSPELAGLEGAMLPRQRFDFEKEQAKLDQEHRKAMERIAWKNATSREDDAQEESTPRSFADALFKAGYKAEHHQYTDAEQQLAQVEDDIRFERQMLSDAMRDYEDKEIDASKSRLNALMQSRQQIYGVMKKIRDSYAQDKYGISPAVEQANPEPGPEPKPAPAPAASASKPQEPKAGVQFVVPPKVKGIGDAIQEFLSPGSTAFQTPVTFGAPPAPVAPPAPKPFAVAPSMADLRERDRLLEERIRQEMRREQGLNP